MENREESENKEIKELKTNVEELTKEVADLKDMCTHTYSDVACCMMAAELLMRKDFEEIYGQGGNILKDARDCLRTIDYAKLADSFYMKRSFENNLSKEDAEKFVEFLKGLFN